MKPEICEFKYEKAPRRKIYRIGRYEPDAKNIYGKTLYDKTTYRVECCVTTGGPAEYTAKHPSGIFMQRLPARDEEGYFLLPDAWIGGDFDTDALCFDDVIAVREDAPLAPCSWPSAAPIDAGIFNKSTLKWEKGEIADGTV